MDFSSAFCGKFRKMLNSRLCNKMLKMKHSYSEFGPKSVDAHFYSEL